MVSKNRWVFFSSRQFLGRNKALASFVFEFLGGRFDEFSGGRVRGTTSLVPNFRSSFFQFLFWNTDG